MATSTSTATSLLPLAKHGMSTSYVKFKCRCAECRGWNREHTNAYLAEHREHINAGRRVRYAKDPDKYLRLMRRNREFLSRYKMLAGCNRCGYREHPFVLQFHHLDRSTKDFQIGTGSTRSLKKIKAEIRKCVVLCANCHALIEACRGGDSI